MVNQPMAKKIEQGQRCRRILLNILFFPRDFADVRLMQGVVTIEVARIDTLLRHHGFFIMKMRLGVCQQLAMHRQNLRQRGRFLARHQFNKAVEDFNQALVLRIHRGNARLIMPIPPKDIHFDSLPIHHSD